jgi:hypothetical protein
MAPIPARIQDEIRQKEGSGKSRDPDLKSKVNRLQWSVTNKLNEWRNDQWSLKLEIFDREDQ